MRRVLQALRRHPFRSLGATALVLVAAAAVSNRDLIAVALADDDPIDLGLPLVPVLEGRPGETVYRIDPDRSLATVTVAEQLAGVDRRAVLTTQGITGSAAVTADGRSVRLGEVAVDVHQLRSDDALRDKVLRHEFLESHRYREVRLRDATVTLPDGATATRADGAVIAGTLVVKGSPHPVRWRAEARLDGDTLTAEATTTVRLSELGVGPIRKAGLVQTSDEARVVLRLVAVDGGSFTPPSSLEMAEAAAGTAAGGPSFAREVRPVLAQNCASCHQPGSAGASAWRLADAGDAADVADGLALVTSSGYMPPWPPSRVGVPLQHERGLTAAQLRTLRDWARAGAPLDVPRSSAVRPPAEPEVPQPRADVSLRLPEPYQGSPAVRDDYRCFVLDPGLTAPRFLTGYTFTPDQRPVVHHALVYRVAAAARPGMDRRDAADPGPGWACAAGMGGGTAGGELVAGWVPGQRPADFGPGVGFPFQPGDVLVAQIHYHFDDASPPDRSGMTLELSDDPATVPLVTKELVGPVELPCPPGSAAPLCDRAAAVADVAARFGPGARMVANGLHRICGTTPEQLAAASDGERASTTCRYPVEAPAQIVDVLGHMHTLGASYRMTLNPGRPDERVLLDIPVWDFGWQLNYQPVEPVAVGPGDTIEVTCRWDRRVRHDPEPRWIVFAEGTQDEMCFSTVTFRPVPSPPSPAPAPAAD